MTATQTAVRAFGACFVKGCKHRDVTMLVTGDRAGRIYFNTADGFREHAAGGYFPQVDAKMRAAGLVCPDHGATMRYEGLNATYNPDKVCDGRCLNAKRASCDCSCRGENHGRQFAF